MPIGNQKFGIPRKYEYQIGIGYFCPKVLGIFLVFYRHIEYDLLKLWFNIGIFGRIKIGLVFGFSGCHFIGIGLVSVCNFPENVICRPMPLPTAYVPPSHPCDGLAELLAGQVLSTKRLFYR